MKLPKSLGLLGVMLLIFVATSCGPKKDAQRKLPGDVVREFASSVQAGDFETARTYWSPKSVTNIEGYFKVPFKDFCQSRFNCRQFRIEPEVRQKDDYWTVVYISNCDGVTTSYEFYVKAINEVYCLTYDLWELPGPGEQQQP